MNASNEYGEAKNRWIARSSFEILLAGLVVSLAVFAIVGFLHFDDRTPAYQLLDDPTDFSGVKWYTGLFSNLVVLFWCASATVCGFAGYSLKGSSSIDVQELSRMLLWLCAANIWIMLDDLLLVHEQAARLTFGKEFQHFGEGLILAIYIGAVGSLLWRYRATIVRREPLVLLAAVASLGASIAIDVGFQLELGGNNPFRETVLSVSWGATVIDIAEEILKLNGALLWFVYWTRIGLAAVREYARP